MEQNVAREILTEVRELGTRLDAKIDGVRDELKAEIRGVESRLEAKIDTKIDLARTEWRGYFDELSASTQHCYGQLSAQVDALHVEVVRNQRKRR